MSMLHHPPSPERLIQTEVDKFLRVFPMIETPGGLSGALWQFAAQCYNLGALMGGSVNPNYGPPAVIIERLMRQIEENEAAKLPKPSWGDQTPQKDDDARTA